MLEQSLATAFDSEVQADAATSLPVGFSLKQEKQSECYIATAI